MTSARGKLSPRLKRADLFLLRGVKSGSSFYYWLLSVIVGATTLLGLGPVACAIYFLVEQLILALRRRNRANEDAI